MSHLYIRRVLNLREENYHPISLTSIVCKIGEIIVLDRMITSGAKLTL